MRIKIEQEQTELENCTCNDFIGSVKEINMAIMLAWNHGMPYHGRPFVYCPWCGKKLDVKKKEGNNETKS